MSNLAISYYHLEKYQDALELEEKALQVRRDNLGKENPQTLESIWNLLFILADLGMKEQRLKLLHEALPLYEKVHGKEHSETIRIQEFVNENLYNSKRNTPSEQKDED